MTYRRCSQTVEVAEHSGCRLRRGCRRSSRTVDVDEVVEQIAASGHACRTSQKPNRRHLVQVLN
jgi:hypothetical protein